MSISREEIKQKLGEGATEEQITSMLDLLHSSEKTLKDEKANLQNQLDKQSDYADMKKKLSDIEQANLTEQEKMQKDKEEIARNLKESRIEKNKAKVMSVLAEFNLSEDIINNFIDEDENISLNKANTFAETLKNLKEETAKKTKEELANVNIKPSIDNKNLDTAMTFEKFRALSVEEQNRFATEHPEEFEKL